MWGWLDWARSWERIARESVISSLIFPPQPPPCSLTLLTSTVQDHPDICTVLWILISYLLSPTLRIQQVLHSALSRPPRSLIMQTPENTELDIIRLAPLTATTSTTSTLLCVTTFESVVRLLLSVSELCSVSYEAQLLQYQCNTKLSVLRTRPEHTSPAKIDIHGICKFLRVVTAGHWPVISAMPGEKIILQA